MIFTTYNYRQINERWPDRCYMDRLVELTRIPSQEEIEKMTIDYIAKTKEFVESSRGKVWAESNELQSIVNAKLDEMYFTFFRLGFHGPIYLCTYIWCKDFTRPLLS